MEPTCDPHYSTAANKCVCVCVSTVLILNHYNLLCTSAESQNRLEYSSTHRGFSQLGWATRRGRHLSAVPHAGAFRDARTHTSKCAMGQRRLCWRVTLSRPVFFLWYTNVAGCLCERMTTKMLLFSIYLCIFGGVCGWVVLSWRQNVLPHYYIIYCQSQNKNSKLNHFTSTSSIYVIKYLNQFEWQ